MLINSRIKAGKGLKMQKKMESMMQKGMHSMKPKMQTKNAAFTQPDQRMPLFIEGGAIPGEGDPKPKPKGLYYNDETAFNPSQLGQQQEYAGVNPNNEAEFITQGDLFSEGNRINTIPGYTGNTENITRDKYNQYLDAQKAFNNQEVAFNEDGTVTNSIENPFAEFENSALDNPRLMKDFQQAFADENLNSLDYTTGEFNQPENDINTINETDRNFSGISQFNRSRNFVPEPDVVGIPSENLSNFEMPFNEPRALPEPQTQQEEVIAPTSPKAAFGSYGTTKRQKYLSRQNKKRLSRKMGGRIKPYKTEKDISINIANQF